MNWGHWAIIFGCFVAGVGLGFYVGAYYGFRAGSKKCVDLLAAHGYLEPREPD